MTFSHLYTSHILLSHFPSFWPNMYLCYCLTYFGLSLQHLVHASGPQPAFHDKFSRGRSNHIPIINDVYKLESSTCFHLGTGKTMPLSTWL